MVNIDKNLFALFLLLITLINFANAIDIDLTVTGNGGVASFQDTTSPAPETTGYQEVTGYYTPEITTEGTMTGTPSTTVTTTATSNSGSTSTSSSSVTNGDMTNRMSVAASSQGASANQDTRIKGSGNIVALAEDLSGHMVNNRVIIDNSMWDLLNPGIAASQNALIGTTSAKATQTVKGDGDQANILASMSIKDGNGKEAKNQADGKGTENIDLNQIASADNSDAIAYQTGSYNSKSMSLTSWAEDRSENEAATTKAGEVTDSSNPEIAAQKEPYASRALQHSKTFGLRGGPTGIPEAKAELDPTGVFYNDKTTSTGLDNAQASQDVSGLGHLESATTSAKDGSGREAGAGAEGSFSGLIRQLHQDSLVDPSQSYANQVAEVELSEPFETNEDCLIDFKTLAQDGSGKEAMSRVNGRATEHAQLTQTAQTDSSTAQALQDVNIIDAAEVTSLAKDGRGSQAITDAGLIGVFSQMQEASTDSTISLASQSVKGVGYLESGTTSTEDGMGKGSITGASGFTGNVIEWQQASSTDASGSNANQKVYTEYMPVSYQTGTYDENLVNLATSAIGKWNGQAGTSASATNSGMKGIQSASAGDSMSLSDQSLTAYGISPEASIQAGIVGGRTSAQAGMGSDSNLIVQQNSGIYNVIPAGFVPFFPTVLPFEPLATATSDGTGDNPYSLATASGEFWSHTYASASNHDTHSVAASQ